MAFFRCIRGRSGSQKLIAGQVYEGELHGNGHITIGNHSWYANRFERMPEPLATDGGALEYEEAMAAQELLG